MSDREPDDSQAVTAELLAEAQQATGSVGELRASIRGLVDSLGRTARTRVATLWNLLMVSVGVAIYLHYGGYAAMAGVAWAVFNAYPLGLAAWRWLT